MATPISDPYVLGAAVRDARSAHGWTQSELARRSRVSRQFIVSLERGSGPRSELIRVLAVLRALGKAIELVDVQGPATIDDLLGEVLE